MSVSARLNPTWAIIASISPPLGAYHGFPLLIESFLFADTRSRMTMNVRQPSNLERSHCL
jgi:hypothetical protein